MHIQSYPIMVGIPLISQNKTVFYLPQKEVTATLPSSLSRRLIKICDGTHSLVDLKNYLSQWWDTNSLENLFQRLLETGALIDSRDMSPHVWQFMRNPTAWKPDLAKQDLADLMFGQDHQQCSFPQAYTEAVPSSDWTELLQKRSSSRKFGNNVVKKNDIVRMLWSAYGKIGTNIGDGENLLARRSIPSAGALYPLVINLCLFDDVEDLEQGVYRIIANKQMEITFHRLGGNEKIGRCFVDPSGLKNAVGCIIVSANIHRTTVKYGNRAMLYCALEAGHAAQNVLLSAQHDNVATVEVGGFFEEEFSKLLKHESTTETLITVVFGSPPSDTKDVEDDHVISLEDIVQRVEIQSGPAQDYTLPFIMAFAESTTPITGAVWWSCGRDLDKKMAVIKAEAEACEWYLCGRSADMSLIDGTYQELGNRAIDPRKMISYLPEQLGIDGKVESFADDHMYEWLKVQSIKTGNEHLVLADFAFFPYAPKYGRRYAYANSSGAAAHVTSQEALEHAVLETIEREAFMVTWLNRLRRSSIDKSSVPIEFQKRIRALELSGFDVSLIDISYNLTPVIMVFIKLRNVPFISCSTASGYELSDILDRALAESEASAYCKLRDGSSRVIFTAEEVVSTMDHGAFYENAKLIQRVSFLAGNTKKPTTFKEMGSKKYPSSKEELYSQMFSQELDILTCEITDNSRLRDLPYKVVRAFIPGMVPINFGYGIEPFGMSRVRTLPIQSKVFFPKRGVATLNRLPHPFT